MDIYTLISNVGFPIAACVAMGWYCKNITERFGQQIQELQEDSTKNTIDMTVAVMNNTNALEKLIERIDSDGKNIQSSE